MKADAINPEFLNIFANILMELEEWEKAKIYLTKSLYINPDLLATHFNIGYVYQKLGKAKQAEKHFQNLLKDLETMEDDAVVSEMDNMTAGRLKELTLMMAAL
jgi:chemotaxis protein methyltransferase CheR